MTNKKNSLREQIDDLRVLFTCVHCEIEHYLELPKETKSSILQAFTKVCEEAKPASKRLSEISGTKAEKIVGKCKALGYNQATDDYFGNIKEALK